MVQLLNRNSQIVIAPETHYFDDLRPRIAKDQIRFPDTETTALAERYFARLRAGAYALNGTERPDDGSITPAPRGPGLDDMFRAHCLGFAPRQGKSGEQLSWWGEKTPRHVFRVKEILTAFPEARFICMLRDPRAVVASYRDWRNHYIDPSQAAAALRSALEAEQARVRRSYSIFIAAMMWRMAEAAARRWQARLGAERFRIQRFESLLADPRGEIAAISAMLAIDPDDGMPQVGRFNSSYGHDASSGIDPEAGQAWRTRMSDAEIWTVETLCRGPMRRGGYVRASARAHPGFLLRELARTLWQVPLAFAANRHRMGNPLVWTIRRVTGGLR